MTMYRYLIFGVLLVCAGCVGPKQAQVPNAHTVTDELVIKVEPAEGDKIGFWMEHRVDTREKGAPEAHGRKNAFAIMVEPSVWARVKRSAAVIGLDSETECLLGGEMVRVSGMPGENFSVKIEPLVMNRFRVTGIYLASRYSESGELGKTIPFDFTAVPGAETVVYRKTTVFDPEAESGGGKLMRR